ncbi:MAG: response regulator transcription factor [Thermoanaerobaculia bacterium]|nr:response regulator transcription factor [Thermoanaerobaculia bacterium]
MSAFVPPAVVQLVDDDADVRRALTRLLTSAGLEVRSFASAEAFLLSAELEDAACLVLDLRMPGASGLDLQAELAARGFELPVLFLSGHGDVRSSVSAMKSGAVDFLQKPVDEAEFLAAVGRAREMGVLQRAASHEVAELESRFATLTPREREVMALVVEGRLNKQVAAALGVAEKTVKVHRARVMEKMAASSLADLVRKAGRLPASGSDTGGLLASGSDTGRLPK